MTKMFSLPGAGASAVIRQPVADQLDRAHPKRLFSWPGLGKESPAADVRGIDDLVPIIAELHELSDLIGMHAAIALPENIRRMVLTATSAGVPVDDLSGAP